jgi:aryl-alcohol dehydrogenase-like predicted oxidoreductase
MVRQQSAEEGGSSPAMKKIQLGQSDLHVTPVCLGTMTFGEQVDEPTSHSILSRSLERGVDFIDTAEMYSVPTRKETFSVTETIIGNWFAANPGARAEAGAGHQGGGSAAQHAWVRKAVGMTAADIVASATTA